MTLTFRQQCAITAMRELIHVAAAKSPLKGTEAEFCKDLAEGAFAIADAMIAAAGSDASSCGAATSRTVKP